MGGEVGDCPAGGYQVGADAVADFSGEGHEGYMGGKGGHWVRWRLFGLGLIDRAHGSWGVRDRGLMIVAIALLVELSSIR